MQSKFDPLSDFSLPYMKVKISLRFAFSSFLFLPLASSHAHLFSVESRPYLPFVAMSPSFFCIPRSQQWNFFSFT